MKHTFLSKLCFLNKLIPDLGSLCNGKKKTEEMTHVEFEKIISLAFSMNLYSLYYISINRSLLSVQLINFGLCTNARTGYSSSGEEARTLIYLRLLSRVRLHIEVL